MTDKRNRALYFRRYPFLFFSIILLLSCLVYLFSSCEREEDVSANGGITLVPPSGEPVTINFTIGERDFGNNRITVRSTAQPINPSEEVYSLIVGELEGVSKREPAGSSLYMYASLIENETPVRLRSSQLGEDTKVRIAAYDFLTVPNDTILLAFADYSVETGALVPHGTPPMTVPSGSILFVAYSFNDTITMDAFNETIAAIGSRDLLWGDTTVTVGSGNTNVHIILDHLFSKIEVQAETVLNPTSDIHEIYGAHYDHAFPALTVQNGDLTPGTPDTIHVNWQSTSIAATWQSEEHFVYTSGNPPVVTIDSVTIDGNSNNHGPYTTNYTTPLAPGREYTLYLRFRHSSSGLTVTPDEINLSYLAHNPASESLSVTAPGAWTLSIPNLGANQWLWLSLNSDGSSPQLYVAGNAGTTTIYLVATQNNTDSPRLSDVTLYGTSEIVSTISQEGIGGSADRITIEGSGTGAKLVITRNERDAGLYFKFGSVVGLNSKAGGTQDLAMERIMGTDINSSSVINNWIAFNPTGTTFMAYGNTNTTPGNIPGWNYGVDGAIINTFNDSYHNIANVKAGKGDPCRLIGMTVAQINAMGADADLYGLELSLKQSGVGGWRMPTNLENQAITQGANHVSSTDFWTVIPHAGTILGDVPGAIFPDKFTGHISTFLPAAGYINNNGVIWNQGLNGYYWMSQPVGTGANAFYMTFTSGTLYTNSQETSVYSQSIRCIHNENDPVIPPLPVVSPSSITLSGSAYTPTLAPGQVVNVTATGSRILTSNMPWMRLTLNPDGSGAGMSVTATGNRTVYLMVDGNSSTINGRAANILLGSTVMVTVVQGAYEPGGYAERITWEAPDATYPAGRYVLTGNYTDAGLHFRFGSVVGIFSGAGNANQTLPGTNTSVFNAAIHIAWSPVAIAGSGAAGWAGIPYVPASVNLDTIDVRFHTLSNVRAGLGDPCRLAGLDLSAIANLSNPNPVIDNGEWMLPTPLQNGQFTAGTIGSDGSHWWNNSSPFGPGVSGAEFPTRNSNSGTPNPAKFLPANGLRGWDPLALHGEAGYFGQQGRYWGNATILNPATSVPEGSALGFNQGSASTSYGSYGVHQAFGVRCVRQP